MAFHRTKQDRSIADHFRVQEWEADGFGEEKICPAGL